MFPFNPLRLVLGNARRMMILGLIALIPISYIKGRYDGAQSEISKAALRDVENVRERDRIENEIEILDNDALCDYFGCL